MVIFITEIEWISQLQKELDSQLRKCYWNWKMTTMSPCFLVAMMNLKTWCVMKREGMMNGGKMKTTLLQVQAVPLSLRSTQQVQPFSLSLRHSIH